MERCRHASARDFLDTVGAALRQRPVINQLAIAIAGTCVVAPARYGSDLRFYSAAEGGALQGVALQTPPWPVQVAACAPKLRSKKRLGIGEEDRDRYPQSSDDRDVPIHSVRSTAATASTIRAVSGAAPISPCRSDNPAWW